MRPILRDYEREKKFPDAEIRGLGELGCCGMLIPEEWGGAGIDTVSYAVMLEEVARVCASTAVALSVTNSVAGRADLEVRHRSAEEKISDAAGEGRNSRLVLPDGAAGGLGRGGDSDASGARGSILCNGTKSWVTNGGLTGVYVPFRENGCSGGREGRDRVSCRADFPRLSGGRYEDKMGLQLSRSAELVLDDLPRSDRESDRRRRAGAENRARGARWRARKHRGAVGGHRAGAFEAAVSTRSSGAHSAKRSASFRPFSGCSRTCRRRSRRRAGCSITRRGCGTRARQLRRRGGVRRRRGRNCTRARWPIASAYKAVQIHGSVGYSRETRRRALLSRCARADDIRRNERDSAHGYRAGFVAEREPSVAPDRVSSGAPRSSTRTSAALQACGMV